VAHHHAFVDEDEDVGQVGNSPSRSTNSFAGYVEWLSFITISAVV
jgi:hypothetical protein